MRLKSVRIGIPLVLLAIAAFGTTAVMSRVDNQSPRADIFNLLNNFSTCTLGLGNVPECAMGESQAVQNGEICPTPITCCLAGAVSTLQPFCANNPGMPCVAGTLCEGEQNSLINEIPTCTAANCPPPGQCINGFCTPTGPLCHNGIIDPGEDCDPGINGTLTCCTPASCTFLASGTPCQSSPGACPSQCSGNSAVCPVADPSSCSPACSNGIDDTDEIDELGDNLADAQDPGCYDCPACFKTSMAEDGTPGFATYLPQKTSEMEDCLNSSDAGSLTLRTNGLTAAILPNPCLPCGNSAPDPGEECDDGNQNNFDECTNMCRTAICGDAIVGISRTPP